MFDVPLENLTIYSSSLGREIFKEMSLLHNCFASGSPFISLATTEWSRLLAIFNAFSIRDAPIVHAAGGGNQIVFLINKASFISMLLTTNSL